MELVNAKLEHIFWRRGGKLCQYSTCFYLLLNNHIHRNPYFKSYEKTSICSCAHVVQWQGFKSFSSPRKLRLSSELHNSFVATSLFFRGLGLRTSPPIHRWFHASHWLSFWVQVLARHYDVLLVLFNCLWPWVLPHSFWGKPCDVVWKLFGRHCCEIRIVRILQVCKWYAVCKLMYSWFLVIEGVYQLLLLNFLILGKGRFLFDSPQKYEKLMHCWFTNKNIYIYIHRVIFLSDPMFFWWKPRQKQALGKAKIMIEWWQAKPRLKYLTISKSSPQNVRFWTVDMVDMWVNCNFLSKKRGFKGQFRCWKSGGNRCSQRIRVLRLALIQLHTAGSYTEVAGRMVGWRNVPPPVWTCNGKKKVSKPVIWKFHLKSFKI